jgi:hypothetical protein
MRLMSVLLLGCLAGAAHASDPKAPDWQPLPPPPALDQNAQDSDLEPQVTISKKGDQLVEEYRVGGKLYMIKVTPKVGLPYYMIDERGDGQFSRQDGPDSSFLIWPASGIGTSEWQFLPASVSRNFPHGSAIIHSVPCLSYRASPRV